METIQIVGYKNSGKTTTAIKLIEKFSQRGIQVASLKHHGHGGIPLGLENKDSFKHQQAGAMISGVEGEGILQLAKRKAWSLEQILAIYEIFGVDLLILEGFKREHYQKVVLINKEEDLILLDETTNILAVISSIPVKSSSYITFNTYELQDFCDWMLQWYKNKAIR
ncbi:molybdopterin-guanine dinucleotide biosynthesis protein B [Oceanobacillus piezotolerans]|nr:molybdopterin-guanine dinucleotide biosynthesis protein B [Oceanobacillus piezotolerans]